MRITIVVAILVAIVTVGAPVPARGSTLLVPTDRALVEQTPVIAEVSVMSVSDSPAVGIPSTDYVVLVERLVKGRLGGTSVVVRVPGGIGPDGIGFAVHGAPAFREGERALLFLAPRSDGTYGIVHLALGAFHQRSLNADGASRTIAVRNIMRSKLLEPIAALDSARDWNRFILWLERQATGRRASADYFLDTDDAELPVTWMSAGPTTVSWPQLVRGKRVRWSWLAGDDETGTAGVGRNTLRMALSQWTGGKSSAVRLGITSRSRGFSSLSEPDGVNAVIFDDPEELVPGSFSCRSGGLAAISGTWFDPAVTFRFRAGSEGVAIRAIEADVIVNEGARCLFGDDRIPGVASAVIAHEIGHTLGLEHAADPASLMFPLLLDRGGLAAPSAEDRERLGFLYPPAARAGEGSRRPARDGD